MLDLHCAMYDKHVDSTNCSCLSSFVECTCLHFFTRMCDGYCIQYKIQSNH